MHQTNAERLIVRWMVRILFGRLPMGVVRALQFPLNRLFPAPTILRGPYYSKRPQTDYSRLVYLATEVRRSPSV
jgi:hypothetical protein